MAHSPKRRKINKKGKIRLSERVRIVEKNDNTRVAKRDTFPTIEGRPPANLAPTFKIKIKKKR